ncbi:hypothetical protein JCM8202_003939 [Rhodotorula sphaerocarpa]
MSSPLFDASSRRAPIASTSRAPYTPAPGAASATNAMSPPLTRALATSAARASPRSSARPTGRPRAHLIHPMVRQRLTNLTFLSAGLLSVLTVSLTMSGTFGDGAAPGCPARVRTAVALEERERRRAGEDAVDDGRQHAERWWQSSQAKGRFLEDPVPATAMRAPVPSSRHAGAGAESASSAASRRDEVQVYGPGVSASDSRRDEERIPRRGDWRSGWSGLRNPEERIV